METINKNGMISVPINKIKGNPKNPRVINDDKFAKLVKSLREFPQMLEKRPLVCFTDIDGKYVVLGGNMRLKAAQEIGMKELPISLADDWTEEQKNEFLIKDNVGFGEWDWDELANDWDSEQLADWGLDIPGFEVAQEATEDDFDGVPPKEPITVLGDLYELNEHRLHCASSTETDTFEKLMQGELADMVVTDPPYNVAYEGGTKEKLTIKNDSMGNDDFYKFLYDFYTALGSYTKPGGAWYVWFADVEIVNFAKAFLDGGFKLAQMLIWKKNSLVMGRKDYHFLHEPCLYGWKEGAAHGWYSDRKQTTILEFDRPSRNAEHPTMKPVALFAYQIGNSSKQGDIVADGFGGSGTTMIAADQMQRKAYLQELDPKYCDVIVSRYIKHRKETGSSLVIKRNGQRLSEDEIEKYIENTKTGE